MFSFFVMIQRVHGKKQDMQGTKKCNNHARSSNHPCRGKAVCITYSE